MNNGQAFPIFEVEEWKSCVIKDARLVDEDQAMIERLRSKGEGRLEIDELKEGVRVRTKSWVGVVRFSQFEIHVLPKLPGEIVNVLKMLDYASGYNDLKRFQELGTVELKGASLLELIVDRFLQECDKVLRGGLLVDYVEQEEALPYVRGRLLTDRQVLRRFGMFHLIECSYDDHLMDIAENQLLSLALAVATKLVSNPEILARAHRLNKLFSECCTTNHLRLEWLKRTLVYNRRNAHYAEAHGLAWFLLDNLGISDIYQGNSRCFAFLFDMNRLFERFLRRWLEERLASEYEISNTDVPIAGVWNAEKRRVKRFVPDFLIRCRDSGKPRSVLDAKYKLYDKKSLDISDLYQTTTYAFIFETYAAEKPPEAFVLYPSQDTVCARLQRFQMRNASGCVGAVVSIIGLHIPSIISEIEDESKLPVWQKFRELLWN